MFDFSEFNLQTPNGVISLHHYSKEVHSHLIYQWVKQPYANYWGMGDDSFDEFNTFYDALIGNVDHRAYVAYLHNRPVFLIEVYNPEKDGVGQCYSFEKGDVGMHVLMSPPDVKISGFTLNMMRFIMTFLFIQKQVKRVIVEPDAKNEKIHILNNKVGFHHVRPIKIGDKDAFLGICTKEQFLASGLIQSLERYTYTDEHFIEPKIWSDATRHLVAKMISEFSHERLIFPKSSGEKNEYSIESKVSGEKYIFNCERLWLDHWVIDKASLKKIINDQEVQLDALKFVLEFNDVLCIPSDKLPVYLEEISATLYSATYKLKNKNELAPYIANADFQFIEQAMTEGHPSFVANNGRVGFDAHDYQKYAPEVGSVTPLVWLAASKDKAHFAHCDDISYQQLIEQELDLTLRNKFDKAIEILDLCPDNYWLMPVHPWQWFNKLAHIFSSELANHNLIFLGYGETAYQSQQSIRTFFNRTNPCNYYVKTALSVLNMGFMRGLSSYYMKSTPAINDWLKNLLENDAFIQSKRFKILREIASVGYVNSYFENDFIGDTPYRKMLAALWRESPLNCISDNQRLMTMAALLHRDKFGGSVVNVLIQQSGLSVKAWVAQYLDAYLSPLLHCYYAHNLVYMPHGENIILVIENNAVDSVIMKDLGEEICLLNSDKVLADNVSRIKVKVPESHELLSFFTDVFDGFFRYLAEVLHKDALLDQSDFWSCVADCVYVYMDQHPEYKEKYKRHDLFKSTFEHSCLNRLQLANNLQMISLAEPSSLLQIQGEIDNPISSFKR